MSDQPEQPERPEKTFKVQCVNADCAQPFHVRFPLANPGATEPAEVIVECPYCGAENVIAIPSAYVEQEHLLRGLAGRRRS